MNAIQNVMDYNISVLNGFSGAGKSFTTKTLVSILKDNDKSVTLLAPTGRAGKVLRGYANHPASTIHRLLYSLPKEDMICTDVVVVDEVSMADVFLFSWLLSKIDLSCTKLLLIGDSAQIPSVNAGNILHDIMNSNVIPLITLTEIFRYGKGGVMTVATNTRLQKRFLKEQEGAQIIGEDKGYIFYHTTSPKNAITLVKQFYLKMLEKNPPEDILLLSPYNIGACGSQVINSVIQPIANPQSVNNSVFIETTDNKFYVGDLVLQTKNNYKSKRFVNSGWDRDDSMEQSLDSEDNVLISNGDIGKVEYIGDGKCIINFDDIKIVYDKFDMGTCRLGYSISTTKSQGGNAKNVILVTMPEHERNLNSNLMYVGQSRAREKVCHVGSYATVNRALLVKAENDRKTHLKQLLMEAVV
jgi:ATP-dependent exoDNAse (exonuclease V) alpha subunit